MSIQPTPVIFGPRLGVPPDESAIASLLQTVSKVLDILRRRWPLFAVPLLTTMMIILAFGLTYPRRCWVSTSFERRNNLVISKLISSNSPYSFAALRQSLVADVKNLGAMAAACEQLGLLKGLSRDASGELTPEARARRDEVAGHWAGSISVFVRESGDFLDIVEMRYLGEQPEQAAAMLALLRDNYTTTTRAKVSAVVNDALAFFNQESQKCQDKVMRLRDELRRIDAEHPGTNPNGPAPVEQQMQALVQSLGQLDRERERMQASISAAEQYLSELSTRPSNEGSLANQPAGGDRHSANPRHARIAAEIAGLTRKIDDLKTVRRMTDEHPEVAGIRRRIDTLQADLEKEPEQLDDGLPSSPGSAAAPDPWEADRRKAGIELKTHREGLARIEREIKSGLEEKARLEQEIQKLPERRQGYAQLQQAAQNAQNDLDLWGNNINQLNRIVTAEAENRGIQFVSLEEPHFAGRLHTPTANGFFSLSAGVGLALAVAILFLREVLDRSFKDPGRVKKALGIPVLETIGEIQVGRPAGWFLRRRLLPVAVAVEFLGVVGLGTMVYLALERPELYDQVVARSASLWTS
jgi:hypothetical protein